MSYGLFWILPLQAFCSDLLASRIFCFCYKGEGEVDPQKISSVIIVTSIIITIIIIITSSSPSVIIIITYHHVSSFFSPASEHRAEMRAWTGLYTKSAPKMVPAVARMPKWAEYIALIVSPLASSCET